ncbi:MAG: MFS transporter [Candidatus Brocadiaceae bacterium]|jgi:fucose permease
MSREGAGPTTWRLTGAAWAALFVFATTSTLLSISLKQIGDEFGIGLARRGALAAVRAGALAVSALCIGRAADRWGKKGFLVLAMLATGAGLVWIGSSSAYGSLVAGMIVLALGLGAVEALTSPLVAELHPRNVAQQMNLLHAFYPAGIVLPSLLVGWVLTSGVAWRQPFRLAALPALVVGLIFLSGRYPGEEAENRPVRLTVGQILKNPTFWPLALAMLLGAGCEGGLFYWIPNFLQAQYGVTPMVGGLALTLYSAAMMAGRLGMGAAAGVLTPGGILLRVALAGGVASLALALIPGLAWSLVLIGVTGLCVAAFWPGTLSLAAGRISTGSATLFAMLSVAGIIGFGLTPLAIGAAGEWLGLRAGLCVVPVAFAGLYVVFLVVLRAKDAGEDEEGER